MSEKYSRLFYLDNSLYANKCPVIIKAGALLKDNDTQKIIGQLKLQNISSKTVKYLKVQLVCMDSIGRETGDIVTYEYLDLKANLGEYFGSQTPIVITNSSIRSFNARILEIGFTDNTCWNDNNDIWEPLPKQKELTDCIQSPNALKGYQSLFGDNAYLVAIDHKEIWACACGEINHTSNANCHNCNASHSKLIDIDANLIKNEGDYLFACGLMNSLITDNLVEAIKIFDSLGNFKNSIELKNQAEKKIEKIQNNIKRAKKATKKGITLAVTFFAAIIVIGLVVYNFIPAMMINMGYIDEYLEIYQITDLEIPMGVSKIPDKAFYGCDRLKSVTIPKGVKSIGAYAFADCNNLQHVEILGEIESMGEGIFRGCKSMTSVVLEEGVTTISSKMFSSCTSLNSIKLPDSLQIIGEEAFSYCIALKSITIPNSVTLIEKAAFSYCYDLSSVILSNSITNIAPYMFNNSSALKQVNIPKGVVEIGAYAFNNCKITSLSIPSTVTKICKNAFNVSNSVSINYGGTSSQWKKIDIDSTVGTYFKSATIRYNSK